MAAFGSHRITTSLKRFLPFCFLLQIIQGNNIIVNTTHYEVSSLSIGSIDHNKPSSELPKTWLCGNVDGKRKLQCCADCFCSNHETRFCPDQFQTLNRTKRSPYECVKAKLNKINDFDTGPYLMKSVCLDNAQPTETKMCTESEPTTGNLSAYIPVTGSDGITYRNKHCAKCNNISQYLYWNAVVKCKNPDTILEVSSIDQLVRKIMISKNCNIYFSPRNGYVKPEKCLITSGCFEHSINQDFASYSICTVRRSVFHKQNNILCFRCLIKPIHHGEKPEIFANIAALLDFDHFDQMEEKKIIRSVEDTDMCAKNQINDFYTGSCINVSCTKPLVYHEGECIGLFKSIEIGGTKRFSRESTKWLGGQNYGQFIKVNFAFETNVLLKNLEHVMSQINNVINRRLNKKLSKLKSLELGEKRSVELSREVLFFDDCDLSHPICFIDSYGDLNIVENFFIKTIVCNVYGRHDHSYTVKRLLLNISDTEIQTLMDGTNVKLKYSIYNKPYIRPLVRDNEFQTLPCSNISPRYVIISGYLIINHVSLCPNVKLSKSEYNLIYDNGEICFHNMKPFCLSPNKYLDFEISIVICIDDFKTFGKLWADQYHSISNETKTVTLASNEYIPIPDESLISFICTVLSLLCLFISLLTYCLFKELRTLPGKNNICLIIYLILAHALYQFGLTRTNLGTACPVFGLLTHFFWMMTFGMQTMCCIQVFRCFVFESGHSASSESKKTKTVIFYNCSSFLFAASFVCLNIILAKASSGDIGYGGKICYISEPRRVIFTFALPLGISILANIGLIIAVITKIQKMPKIQKHVKNEKTNVKVYARLSTLTGCTWIFGFLFEWTDILLFSYLFILCTALQGVFIMSAFVLNTHVLKMYRSFFNKNKN